MEESPSMNRPPTVRVGLLVLLGGAVGSLAREWLTPALPAPWFWVPILTVNLLASFIVGWLFVLRDRLDPRTLHFWVGGFCGGFSTFSHFTYELVVLGDAARLAEAGGYVFLAVSLGVGAALFGESVGRRMIPTRSS